MSTALSPYEQHLEDLAAAERALASLKERGKTIRGNELNVLAEGYWLKAKTAKFTLKEAKDALTLAASGASAEDKPVKRRAKKGEGKQKPEPAYVKGAHYKHPDKDEVFPKKGGTEWRWGRRPDWLVAIIPEDMTFEEAKKAYAKLFYKGGDLVNNG